MKRIARTALVLLVATLAAGWWLTRPMPLDADELPAHTPDAAAGQRIFWAGGCASCHAGLVGGKRATGDDRLLLGGGLELDTPFGVFRVPNISPHPRDGIGSWSVTDFVNAVQRGLSPGGRHYYPSFPYTSYVRMPARDVMDLYAFIATLPAVEGTAPAHSLRFPWSFRRGIGAWKRLYLDDRPVIPVKSDGDDLLMRGRELVDGAGHCAECHTPRNRFGGLVRERWLAGAPTLDGEGSVPNITPAGKDVSSWTASDIEYYLETGFTPEFDTVGGPMVAVQEGIAELPGSDRAAIAAYLKAVPAID